MNYRTLTLTAAIFGLVALAETVQADSLCLRVDMTKSRSIRTRKVIAATCPKGYTQLIDTRAFAGPPGPQGATGSEGAPGTAGAPGSNGADGSLAVYGSGVDGDLTVSTTSTLADGLATQFRNLTVAAGVTWTIPAGTTLRCTEQCTIRGTITTSAFDSGGYIYHIAPGTNQLNESPPHIGFALTPAKNGVLGSNSGEIRGPNGGFPAHFYVSGGTDIALLIRGNWMSAGSGGGVQGCSGGYGGSVMRILSKGALQVVAGAVIDVDGANGGGAGCGGGGGGLVVLASQTSVTAAGTINARGGNGAPANQSSGHGGAGGGGAVVALAPVVSLIGSANVNAGTNGAAAAVGVITDNPRLTGAGGGGAAGVGASGGSVAANGSSFDGGNSQTDGVVISKTIDPTALFF